MQIRHRYRAGYSYIYVYRIRGAYPLLVKIGRTRSPVQRLKQQRTALPNGMHVLAVIMVRDSVKAERVLHKRFRRYRPHNEFFWYTPALWWFIQRYKNKRITRRVNYELQNNG